MFRIVTIYLQQVCSKLLRIHMSNVVHTRICDNGSIVTVSRHAYLSIENIWGGKESRCIINLFTQRIAIILCIKSIDSRSPFLRLTLGNAKCCKHVIQHIYEKNYVEIFESYQIDIWQYFCLCFNMKII